jgi:hypothetical protein
MQNFYGDTCIYLNLWQKEINENEEPLWLYAKNLLEYAQSNNCTIFLFGFYLKRITVLASSQDYLSKREFLEDNKIFTKASLSEEEYKEAIKIKNAIKTYCSLFDIIKILLAKKNKLYFNNTG